MIRLVLGLAGLTLVTIVERMVSVVEGFLMWVAAGLSVGLLVAVIVDTVKTMRVLKRGRREAREREKKMDSLFEDFAEAVLGKGK